MREYYIIKFPQNFKSDIALLIEKLHLICRFNHWYVLLLYKFL